MEHIDFHISYECINKCIFCSSAYSIEKFKNHPPLEFKRIISILQEKKKDFNSVNFTGGEPTLYRDFVPLVKAAKKLGYKIYVGTNGGRFADKGFCEEAAPFIADVCFSCHGHTDRLHNLHTKQSASFKRLENAIDNLSAYRLNLLSNTVITRHNILFLKDILNFLAQKNIKHALYSNLAPEGRGLDNYSLILVRLSKIKKAISGLMKLANNKNIVMRFFGVPACILGSYTVNSNDFFWDERLNIERFEESGRFFLKEEKGFLPIRNRVKTKICQACLYKDICGGVFQEYYHLFGDRELAAIRNE